MSSRLQLRDFSPEGEFWVDCRECARATRHEVLFGVTAEDESEDGEYHELEDYVVVQCRGCGRLSFYLRSMNSEERYESEYPEHEDGDYIEHISIFPARVPGRRVLESSSALPFGVAAIYREAHSAFAAELPIVTGIALRAIVEAVCIDKRTAGRTLEERIKSLKNNGHITGAGEAILHDLRFMGNEAAHEIRTHSRQELHVAFDVIENLILNVYILPRHSEWFLRRRAQPIV